MTAVEVSRPREPAPAEPRRVLLPVALVAAFLVFGLVVVWRRLRAAAMVERADAVLAEELDALEGECGASS